MRFNDTERNATGMWHIILHLLYIWLYNMRTEHMHAGIRLRLLVAVAMRCCVALHSITTTTSTTHRCADLFVGNNSHTGFRKLSTTMPRYDAWWDTSVWLFAHGNGTHNRMRMQRRRHRTPAKSNDGWGIRINYHNNIINRAKHLNNMMLLNWITNCSLGIHVCLCVCVCLPWFVDTLS